MFVLGLGMGMIVQVMVLAVQNSVDHRDLGVATGVETFSRSMGATFGVAAFGAILNNRLAYHLPRLLPRGTSTRLDVRTLTASPAAIRRLPGPVHHAVIEALARSIHVTFLFSLPLLVLAFGVTFLLREKPLRETAFLTVPLDVELGPEAAESETVGAGAVLLANARDAKSVRAGSS
jgi:hypothetical protein